MFKRVRISWNPLRGFFVPLPHFTMVPDSFEPILKDRIHANGICPGVAPADVLRHGVTCVVWLPDEHYNEDAQQIDTDKLRKIYRGNDLYDTRDYEPPQVVGDA